MKAIIYYIDPGISRIFIEKTDEEGNKSMVLSSPNNFVDRNEIIAKIINIDSADEAADHIDEGYKYYKIIKYIPIKAGDGVYYDETSSAYRASHYGFARFDRGTSKLTLVEPLQIPKNKIKAYFLIHPTKLNKIPNYSDIEEILVNRKIFSSLDKDEIDKQLKVIDVEQPKLHRIVVAAGQEPVNGYDEYFTPLVKTEKDAGKILEDGRIDFKGVSSVIEVKKGQEILKKIPGVKEKDGYNIFGENVPAKMEEPKGYQRGENIVQSGGDESIYVAAIDGCLELKKRAISVSPVAVIKGNVDYETGNIDFEGSVHVHGSIISGFSVKARDNVLVGKNVEDAYIEAGGDVKVKLGIGGKGSTTIYAGGMVKAKYIINSKIEAAKEIVSEDSIINSNVFSNDKITVISKHGKIIGGETTALYDIIVNESGVIKENKTVLTVGKNLFIERELKKIEEEIKPVQEQVDEATARIKLSFGEELFNNPKEYIKILPPVKKKNCIEMLSKLTALNKELTVVKEKYDKVREKLKLEREPTITIRDKAFPGTIVKIKNSVRLIEKTFENVKFYEDKEQKIIKFTAANRDVI